MTGAIREQHLTCLRAVADQKATVATAGGRHLFTVDGARVTGDLHLAMADLRQGGLVYAVDGGLWLTEAGEQVLANSKQTEEIR